MLPEVAPQTLRLSARRRRIVCAAAIAAAVLMLAAPRLSNLAALSNPWDYDEGVYLATARSMFHGHRLYEEIFCSQTPLHTQVLATAFRLLGDSPQSARLTTLLMGCAALLAAARIAWHAGGQLAAGITAICLATSYLFARRVGTAKPKSNRSPSRFSRSLPPLKRHVGTGYCGRSSAALRWLLV